MAVPPILGALFWHRGTGAGAGALASILGGAGVAVWLAILQGVSVFDPVLPLTVAGVGMALFVGVSLATRPRPGALDFRAGIAAGLARHRVW